MSNQTASTKYIAKEGDYLDDIMDECKLTDLAYTLENDGKSTKMYIGQKANADFSTIADKPIQVRMSSDTFFGNSEVYRLIELIGKNMSAEIIFEFHNLESE